MDLVITFSTIDPYGGTAKVLLEIAKKFNPLAIYTYKYFKEKDSELDEFNIIELSKNSKFSTFRSHLKFHNFKIKEEYDVINAHYSPSHWIRNNNPRVLWYCYSPLRAAYDLYDYRMEMFSWPHKATHYLYSKLYRHYNQKIVDKIEAILTLSENVEHRIRKYMNRESTVLYPGIDHKDFHNNGYKKYFFYPSRIDPTKRMEYVVEAFNKFKKKHRNFELVIGGALREKDVGYYNYLKSIFNGKILTNLPHNKMLELYANCYTVLFAGMNEDFGITPLEAMASSKPVVSVNEGGAKETVVDGKTGFLVNSPVEMCKKMGDLADDPGLVEKIGKAGRSHVKTNFNWKNFLKRFGTECKKVSKM